MHHTRSVVAWVVVLSLVLVNGCRDRDGPLDGTGPGITTCTLDISPVEDILGTAVPLAYAASLAMAAMAGNDIPCVSVTTSCDNPPCQGEVTVALNDSCVLPLGSVGNGYILVTGTWNDTDDANLTAVFQGATIDGQDLMVRQGAFAAVMSGGVLTMTYADQDVEVTGVNAASISQGAWTAEVDNQGTVLDVSDDVMTIYGAREYVGTSGIATVTLTDVVWSPSCFANPTSGEALVLAVGEGSPSELGFHSACDGEVDVNFSLSPACINESIPLDFLD